MGSNESGPNGESRESKMVIPAGSLFTAISITYAVYVTKGDSVASVRIMRDRRGRWPVDIRLRGRKADQVREDLERWITTGTLPPERRS